MILWSGQVRSTLPTSIFLLNAHCCLGTGWAGGDNNVFPTAQNTVSSFDALDQMLLFYDDKELFPNLRHLVVAGHSRGAQVGFPLCVLVPPDFTPLPDGSSVQLLYNKSYSPLTSDIPSGTRASENLCPSNVSLSQHETRFLSNESLQLV